MDLYEMVLVIQFVFVGCLIGLIFALSEGGVLFIISENYLITR